MEFCEPKSEIEQNIEHVYNLSLFEDEFELSMILNESFLQFKLKQKNIITNFYYMENFDLKTINQLFSINLQQIKEAFNYYDKLINDKKLKLIINKNIINLIFKKKSEKDKEIEIKLVLKKIKLSKDEIIVSLLDEVNSLKIKLISKNEKSINELLKDNNKKLQDYINSKIDESKKEFNKLINEKINEKNEEINELKQNNENKMLELNNKFEKKLDEINKILSKIDKENKTNEKNEIIRLKEENNYDNQNLINLNKKGKENNSNLNKLENKSLSNFNNIDELKLANEIYDILMSLTIINKQKESLIGINYDLKGIFINFDKDKIKSYIHHLIDNKTKSEDLINKVLEKLSLLLPQDIIILKKYSGFDIKYPKIGEKIIEGYNKGEHNNFESFLKTMQNKKNVIYTFSKFNKYNCGMNKIENDILGKIDLENITTIEINSFTLGNNFENELNERFFNNKNKKICLLNFTSNEKDLLNKVRLIIENKEKEIKSKQNENIDKTIIFIVYLNREFYNNNIEENKNKIFNETIPLISEYYQIFIDDLNGSYDFTINDILNLNINDLIKKLFSPNFLFDEQIFKTLSYLNFIIDFEYKAINQKNYSKNIGNFLLDNFDIKKKKNQLIIKQMGKDENIICNSFKKKDLVTLNDTNLIFCIAKYLNEIYNHLFNIFYYKAEKDQFFSVLLSLEDSNENNMNIINMVDENDDFQDMKELDFSKNNELKKDMINKVIEIYLEHFSFGNEKGNQNIENINEQLGANKINIILGLQLPGMFPIITSIIKKSRDDIIKKYLINESNLRKNIENENIEKEKENYEKKFNDLNNILLNELIKNDKIKSLIAENELVKKEFVDSFLEDYYIIFIYNNLNIYINELNNKGKGCVFDLSELKKILKFLVKQNDENLKADEALETIANIINWTEAYSIEITYILKVYIMLRNYINNIKKENKEKNIYDMMEDFIKDKKVNYRRDEKCKEYTTRVNRALFNGFESILKIITSCKELYIERKGKNEIFELLNLSIK